MDARLSDSQASCLVPAREILASLLADAAHSRSALSVPLRWIGCHAWRPQTGPSDSARSSPPADVSITWRRPWLTCSSHRARAPRARREASARLITRQKGAAYVPLACILRLSHPDERGALRGHQLAGRPKSALAPRGGAHE